MFQDADVRSFEDIVDIVNRSSHTNEAVPYCKEDKSGLEFHEWKDFLAQCFLPSFVKDVTNSHSFQITRENNGVELKVKKECTDEFFSQTLLPSDFFKKDMDCCKILQGGYNPLSSFKIESGKLSEYRSRYLWKNFNSFLDDEQQQKFIPEYFELNNDAREGDDRLEYFICKHEYRRLSKDDILKKIKEEGIKSFCKY